MHIFTLFPAVKQTKLSPSSLQHYINITCVFPSNLLNEYWGHLHCQRPQLSVFLHSGSIALCSREDAQPTPSGDDHHVIQPHPIRGLLFFQPNKRTLLSGPSSGSDLLRQAPEELGAAAATDGKDRPACSFNCRMTQQSHYWAYTLRKPELKETPVPLFIVAPFIIARTWKRPRCPLQTNG